MNDGGITLAQAWAYGGFLMWVLAGISVVALAVVLYLLFAQRRGALAPRTLVSDVFAKLQGGDAKEARRLCERRPCAFSAMVVAAIDAARNASDGTPVTVVESAIETAGSHAAERLQASVDWLADLAAIAPLVGLLGTVLGMFQAFGSIAGDLAANVRPAVLAQGVSQAIITTVFGLVIAIPCLAFHAFLRRRTLKRIAGLETLGVALAQVFA